MWVSLILLLITTEILWSLKTYALAPTPFVSLTVPLWLQVKRKNFSNRLFDTICISLYCSVQEGQGTGIIDGSEAGLWNLHENQRQGWKSGNRPLQPTWPAAHGVNFFKLPNKQLRRLATIRVLHQNCNSFVDVQKWVLHQNCNSFVDLQQ